MLTYVTKAEIAAKKSGPLHTVDVGNKTANDQSGYLGLRLSKTKNGKAIRVSNRLGESRVFVLLDEVDNMIEALKAVKARGVATSVDEIQYDAA
jgi:hypothetical protein